MEMESTRRSIDRSREPGAKKPRLLEDTTPRGLSNGAIDRSRIASGQAGPRLKMNERDAETLRGVQSQQPPKSQQQNQELVSQYKTALAELTFNSKPIITNLTIIAGENLQVAKWIAATICANILEVPSDQKLPSLYLLDSIVKNIGRDYVKYFATRLPEVFCKAYRQVDSSIHSGMRHLFGTWRTVFPPACLQMIEKELGFPPAINGTSSGTAASRSESQSQRPPHSIHVNPKYLEARQHNLQQSNRVKGVNASRGTSVLSDDEEEDRCERIIDSEHPWRDSPVKEFKHAKREASSESLHEKASSGYEDNEYSSDFSRNSDLGYARAAERVTEQDGRDKSWYKADRSGAEATTTFGSQHEYSKYRAPLPGVAAAQLHKKGLSQSIMHSGSRVTSKNWKNSEEEEYVWDDMSSRYPKKDSWASDETEKMEIEDRLPQPRGDIDIGSRNGDAFTNSSSFSHRGQTTFGNQIPVTWPSRENHLGDISKLIGTTSRISGQFDGHSSTLGLSTSIASPLGKTGLKPLTGLPIGGTPNVGHLANTVSSGGIVGQKRHHPSQAVSPSAQSSVLLHPSSPSSASPFQHQELHNSFEDDRADTRAISLLGQNTTHHHSLHPGRSYNSQPAKSSFPVIQQNHIQPGGLQNFHLVQSQSPQHVPNPSTSMQLSQRQHHSPFSLQPLPEMTSSQPSGLQKHLPQSSVIGNPPKSGPSVLSHSSNSASDIPGQSNTNSVLATLLKSGILSNNSVSSGFPNMRSQDSGTLLPHLSTRPPLPSGPPPTQLATPSSTTLTPASVLDPPPTHHLRTSTLPPLPPGPPPSSSVSGTSLQTSIAANTVQNPFDSLLSSLVAKGLISREKESLAPTAPKVPSQLQNQSLALTPSSSLQVTSDPSHSTILASSSANEFSFPKFATKELIGTDSKDIIGTDPKDLIGTDPKDLIGTEFKADIIRQFHPSVISGLHNDLSHQCNMCSVRLKLKEQLGRHLEWHALRNSDPSSSMVSRRWYVDSGDWVHGSVRLTSCRTSSLSAKVLGGGAENNETDVPADETQCVCMLCGEPFEDFYCQRRDEWMFKGAVYMAIPAVGGYAGASDEGPAEGPIVHKNCISPSSLYDLGLMKTIKEEPANR